MTTEFFLFYLDVLFDNLDQDICEWAQNSLSDRYQEYIFNDEYQAGTTESELINLESISKVPISMWSGLFDETCAH